MDAVEDDLQFFADSECGHSNHTTPGHCAEVFDGWLCWPETAAGTVANNSCPRIYGDAANRMAFRECQPDATWYVHPHSGMPWSNYTMCTDQEDLRFRILINNLFEIGYTISLAALLISLVIFFTFRSLKCTRIRIHTQLFISFTLNNILWIVWYEEVVPYPLVSLSNPVWCQALHLVMQYSMLANYMWMFCEGLHLHLALVVVFVREEVTMKWFFAVGWGAPLLFVIAYAFVRYYVSLDAEFCWISDTASSWILTVPVCISLLASLIFLINALRVIMMIMHPNSPNPAPMGVKRAARAALILIPLFGLQHILIPFRPEAKAPYEHLYQYVTVVIVSLQGLCVSCLFCFANHDVHQAIRAFFHRTLHRSSRFSRYHYAAGGDSAGVYVLNGNSQGFIPMLSFKRKSTTATTVKL